MKSIESLPGWKIAWDYPRPLKLERNNQIIQFRFDGQTHHKSKRAFRVLETSHLPIYSLSLECVNAEMARRAAPAIEEGASR